MKIGVKAFVFCLTLASFLPVPAPTGAEPDNAAEKMQQVSDHYDGERYFNPGAAPPSPLPASRESRRGGYRWIWRWIFGSEWPQWREAEGDTPPGAPPVARVAHGALRVIPVGHATFLIQMDGINILTDPIWSDRCSPVSWAGPRRHRAPGIRFADLPPIDVVLVSHNHYDHLDLPTLEHLAKKGTPRSVVALGNRDLVREAGIPSVDELDWWQAVPLPPDITVTLVPAQHFSSRSLWDRNKTLWGGFVISGPSGNVFFAGDTGYGPHFREIARRFSPIRLAILPIAPFPPRRLQDQPRSRFPSVHMGPPEALDAQKDLGAQTGIAAHFQVFQLGPDGFEDAVNELALTLKERNLPPGSFIAPLPGQVIDLPLP